jgi:hypothetical protein
MTKTEELVLLTLGWKPEPQTPYCKKVGWQFWQTPKGEVLLDKDFQVGFDLLHQAVATLTEKEYNKFRIGLIHAVSGGKPRAEARPIIEATVEQRLKAFEYAKAKTAQD